MWIRFISFWYKAKDENYSNYIFWHPFGSTYIDPYTVLEEVFVADKAFQESLQANHIIEETLWVHIV